MSDTDPTYVVTVTFTIRPANSRADAATMLLRALDAGEEAEPRVTSDIGAIRTSAEAEAARQVLGDIGPKQRLRLRAAAQRMRDA